MVRGLSFNTREHLMDVAERLFAEQGYAETSIRKLAVAAAANQGAVNYHFESKENLYVAVLKRRFDHVHAQRVHQLAALRARTGEGPLPVREILDCLIGPAFETALVHPHFPKLLARNIFTPPPFSADVMQQSMQEMVELFAKELLCSLPSLTLAQIGLRMRMTGGALLFLASAQPHLPGDGTADRRQNYSALLDYVTGGFLAGTQHAQPA